VQYMSLQLLSQTLINQSSYGRYVLVVAIIELQLHYPCITFHKKSHIFSSEYYSIIC
jgi:hypothetical protein